VLKGTIAVVTGATGGIGRAVARQLSAGGAHLILLGRSEARLRVVQDQLPASGAETLAADLADPTAIRRGCGAILGQHPAIHVLVHCAGQFLHASPGDTETPQARRLFDVNFWGPLTLTRELLPALRQGQADVVFVNSSAVRRVARDVAIYRAAKAALHAAAESLREELNPLGIRILSVFPGRTATAMQEAAHQAEGRTYRPERLLQPDDIAEVICHAIRAPRTAEITEIHLRPMLPP
jgi:NADP-dependent 3-hydroxy acid dehydrogenase YdfG